MEYIQSRFLILYFLFISSVLFSQDKIKIVDGIGIDDSLKLGMSKKDIIKLNGKSRSYLYSRIVYHSFKKPKKNIYSKKSLSQKGYIQFKKVVKKYGRKKSWGLYKLDNIFVFYEKNISRCILIMNKDFITEKGVKIGDTWDDVKNKYPNLVNKDIHLAFEDGLKFEFNECGLLKKIWIFPKKGTPASNNIIIG